MAQPPPGSFCPPVPGVKVQGRDNAGRRAWLQALRIAVTTTGTRDSMTATEIQAAVAPRWIHLANIGGAVTVATDRERAESHTRSIRDLEATLMSFEVEQTSDAMAHVRNIRSLLNQTAEHARADLNMVEEPQARALFETTAEVLIGLMRAYEHYEQGSEAAWRR